MPGISELARQEEEELVTGTSEYVAMAIVTVKANSMDEALRKLERLTDDHPWLDITDRIDLA